jgi:hypothetical protein
VNESNLAMKLEEYNSREDFSDLREEELLFILALRDPVKGPLIRNYVEERMNGRN